MDHSCENSKLCEPPSKKMKSSINIDECEIGLQNRQVVSLRLTENCDGASSESSANKPLVTSYDILPEIIDEDHSIQTVDDKVQTELGKSSHQCLEPIKKICRLEVISANSDKHQQILSKDSKLSSEAYCIPGLDYIKLDEDNDNISYSCELCEIKLLSGPELGTHMQTTKHLQKIMIFFNPFASNELWKSEKEVLIGSVMSKQWKWLHTATKELELVTNHGVVTEAYRSLIKQYEHILLSSKTKTDQTCPKFTKVVLVSDDQSSSLESFTSSKVQLIPMSKVSVKNIKQAVSSYSNKSEERILWLVFLTINTICKSQPCFHCAFHNCSPAKQKIELDAQNIIGSDSEEMCENFKQFITDVQSHMQPILSKGSELHVMPFLPAVLELETKCPDLALHKHKQNTYMTIPKHCETLVNTYEIICHSTLNELGKLYVNVMKPIQVFIEDTKKESTFTQFADAKHKHSQFGHFFRALRILVDESLVLREDFRKEKIVDENEAMIREALSKLDYDRILFVTSANVEKFLPRSEVNNQQFSHMIFTGLSERQSHKILSTLGNHSPGRVLVVIIPDVSYFVNLVDSKYCTMVECDNPVYYVHDFVDALCKRKMKDIISLSDVLRRSLGSRGNVLLMPIFPRLMLKLALPHRSKEHEQVHDIANFKNSPLIWRHDSRPAKEFETIVRKEMTKYFSYKYKCSAMSMKLSQYAFLKYLHLGSSSDINLKLWIEILNLIVNKLSQSLSDNASFKIDKSIVNGKETPDRANGNGDRRSSNPKNHRHEVVCAMRKENKTTKEILQKLSEDGTPYKEALQILQTSPASEQDKAASIASKEIRTSVSNNSDYEPDAHRRSKSRSFFTEEKPMATVFLTNVMKLLKLPSLKKRKSVISLLASEVSSSAKVTRTDSTSYKITLPHQAASKLYSFLDGYNVGMEVMRAKFECKEPPIHFTSAATRDLEKLIKNHLYGKLTPLAKLILRKSLKKSFLFLHKFKASRCREATCWDQSCIFFHNDSEKRRNPYEFSYSSEMCRFVGNCRKGDGCKFSHNAVEQNYLPSVYKTKLCSTPGCSDVLYCPFVHKGHLDTLCTKHWQDLYMMGLKGTGDTLFTCLKKFDMSKANKENTVLFICYSELHAKVMEKACHKYFTRCPKGGRFLFTYLADCLRLVQSCSSLHLVKTLVLDNFDRLVAEVTEAQILFVFLKELKKILTFGDLQKVVVVASTKLSWLKKAERFLNCELVIGHCHDSVDLRSSMKLDHDEDTDLESILQQIIIPNPTKGPVPKPSNTETSVALNKQFHSESQLNIMQQHSSLVRIDNGKRKLDFKEEERHHSKKCKKEDSIREKEVSPKIATHPTQLTENISKTVPVSSSSNFSDSVGWSSITEELVREKEKAERDHNEEYRAYELVPDIHPEYEEQYEAFVKKYNMDHKDDSEKEKDWSLHWCHFIKTQKSDNWKKKLSALRNKYLPKSSLLVESTVDENSTFSITSTLDILDKVKDKFGWLQSAVSGILRKVQLQDNASGMYDLLCDRNAVDVLKMVVQKLEKLCEAQSKPEEEELYRKAISHTNNLLAQVKTDKHTVDVQSIAEATAGKSVDFTIGVIKTALAYEGCPNPPEALINLVLQDVRSNHLQLQEKCKKVV